MTATGPRGKTMTSAAMGSYNDVITYGDSDGGAWDGGRRGQGGDKGRGRVGGARRARVRGAERGGGGEHHLTPPRHHAHGLRGRGGGGGRFEPSGTGLDNGGVPSAVRVRKLESDLAEEGEETRAAPGASLQVPHQSQPQSQSQSQSQSQPQAQPQSRPQAQSQSRPQAQSQSQPGGWEARVAELEARRGHWRRS